MEIRTAGFDEARLERITEHLVGRYVQPGKIPGCQALVARGGDVAYFRSFGVADRERGVPVRDDTIWRIYSMTKPVTSVALMTLYERARFQLTDPVHRFIPSWKGLRVCEAGPDGAGRLVEPARPVTVLDLLTHTSGLTYGFDPADPVDRLYNEAGVRDRSLPLGEFADRLGGLPLKFHPGAHWHYSLATDVCGRLVEILADRPFDEYLREQIFDPLGMGDTGFSVPDGAGDRFAANYVRQDRELLLFDDPTTSAYLEPPRMPSGGGGLVSTTADYFRFCEMLRRGGELDGHRVLGGRTLRFMARNHLPGGAPMASIALGAFGETGFAGIGFGLGFAVVLDAVQTQGVGSAGEFYWGGAASTIFWIDPAEDLVVIFMTQLMPSATFNFRGQLKQLVHQALD